jgi:hypothetical protein
MSKTIMVEAGDKVVFDVPEGAGCPGRTKIAFTKNGAVQFKTGKYGRYTVLPKSTREMSVCPTFC